MLRHLTNRQLKYQLGLWDHVKLDVARTCIWAHVAVGSVQFFVSCWTAGLSFFLVVSWRLPSVPCSVGFPNSHLFLKASKRETPGETEVTTHAM